MGVSQVKLGDVAQIKLRNAARIKLRDITQSSNNITLVIRLSTKVNHFDDGSIDLGSVTHCSPCRVHDNESRRTRVDSEF